MAVKSFVINTEPHIAQVGDTELKFQAEVIGSEFMSAYSVLQEAQSKLKKSHPVKASSTKHARGDEDEIDAEALADISVAMRGFIRTFLLDESKPVFDEMRLPDRILAQLLEWTAELYGGGSGNPGAAGGTSTS